MWRTRSLRSTVQIPPSGSNNNRTHGGISPGTYLSERAPQRRITLTNQEKEPAITPGGALPYQQAGARTSHQAWRQLQVISVFRGQNLGHLPYIFWRQNWGSNKNFRGRFCGQAPLPSNAKAPHGPSSCQVQPCYLLTDPKLHNLATVVVQST